MFGLSRKMANSSSTPSRPMQRVATFQRVCPRAFTKSRLMVNGAVKASITNTKTKENQTTQLNFDLKPVPAAQASAEQKKGKHMVWVPASTGTHIGGRWVEVPDGATEAGALNVQRANAEQLQRAGSGAPATGTGR